MQNNSAYMELSIEDDYDDDNDEQQERNRLENVIGLSVNAKLAEDLKLLVRVQLLY